MGLVLSLKAVGQNTPLGTLPMQYNGGFAGEGDNARLVAGTSVWSHNDVWSANKRVNSYSYYASYDQFFSKLRSGIGITLSHDRRKDYSSIDGAYDHNITNAILSFSPKLSSEGKYTFAPFVDLSYAAEQDTRMGTHLQLTMVGRAGFLFNSKRFYTGVSVFGLIKGERIQVYPGHYVTNPPLVVQAGYTFHRSPESKFAFTPQAAFFFSKNTSYANNLDFGLDLNLMFRYRKFIWSLNNNGIGLGFQNEKFRAMLSQSYIFFSKYNWSGSLSLRYILPKKK